LLALAVGRFFFRFPNGLCGLWGVLIARRIAAFMRFVASASLNFSSESGMAES
jgi:hypothetical protein